MGKRIINVLITIGTVGSALGIIWGAMYFIEPKAHAEKERTKLEQRLAERDKMLAQDILALSKDYQENQMQQSKRDILKQIWDLEDRYEVTISDDPMQFPPGRDRERYRELLEQLEILDQKLGGS